MGTNLMEAETNKDILNASLEAPQIDPVFLTIANTYLRGCSIDKISEEIGVSPDRVSQVLDRKEVKAYIDNVMLSQGYMNKVTRLALMNKVINKIIADSEEAEGVPLTKKDLLEWLKHMNEVEASIKPKDKGPTVAVQVNNNYDNLMAKLFDKKE